MSFTAATSTLPIRKRGELRRSRAATDITDMALSPQILFQGKEANLLELALFAALRQGPMDARALAAQLGLHPQRAHELFDALTAGGLLEYSGDRYSNTEEVDRLLQWSHDGANGRRRQALHWMLSMILMALFLWQFTAPYLRTWFAETGERLVSLPHYAAAGYAQPNNVRRRVLQPAGTNGPEPGRRDNAAQTSSEIYYLVVASTEEANAALAALAADPRENWNPRVIAVSAGDQDLPRVIDLRSR
jgi:hypothetical protein